MRKCAILSKGRGLSEDGDIDAGGVQFASKGKGQARGFEMRAAFSTALVLASLVAAGARLCAQAANGSGLPVLRILLAHKLPLTRRSKPSRIRFPKTPAAFP